MESKVWWSLEEGRGKRRPWGLQIFLEVCGWDFPSPLILLKLEMRVGSGGSARPWKILRVGRFSCWAPKHLGDKPEQFLPGPWEPPISLIYKTSHSFPCEHQCNISKVCYTCFSISSKSACSTTKSFISPQPHCAPLEWFENYAWYTSLLYHSHLYFDNVFHSQSPNQVKVYQEFLGKFFIYFFFTTLCLT